MNKLLLKISVVVMLFSLRLVSAQSYEGTATFKTEILNPNPALIPDSTWKVVLKKQLGEKGYMLQKYYYKGVNYSSKIDAYKEKGYQTFNPKDGLLYSWKVNSDTAITVDSKVSMTKLIKIEELDETEVILGVTCKCIQVTNDIGVIKLWYNRNVMPMDPNLYKGHIYGHYDEVLKMIKCIPLKMEQKGPMSHMVQTVISYKKMDVSDSVFKIPTFGTVIKNPNN